MDGMFNRFKRITAGALALGLALWAPGIPLALAQVDAGTLTECHDAFVADTTLDVAIRDICLDMTDQALEAVQNPGTDPEADAALRGVETTAVAIHEATQTTLQAVENPDALAKSTVEALTKSGVPADVAAKSGDQMKDALAKAKETIQKGGTVEDVAKYLESCKSAMAECSKYLGEGNGIREILATSGGAPGVERGEAYRSMEFLGRVMDPTQAGGDMAGRCLEAHFETTMREMFLAGGPTEGFTGPSPEVMRGMMEQMMACNINPGEVFRGAGEFHGPSPEAYAAMTPEQTVQLEAARQAGDWAALEALRGEFGMGPGPFAGYQGEMAMHDAMQTMMGMEEGMYHDYAGNVVTPEAMFREMATQGYTPEFGPHEGVFMETTIREATTQYMEPKVVENQNYGSAQETIAHAHVLKESHDHNGDGIMEEFHFDGNGDGVADHTHTSPTPH